MKKIVALVATLAMAFMLVACGKSSLSVTSEDDGIHAVAKNRAEGAATGNITIEDGYGMCINHIVESGSFHVKAIDQEGNVVFDDDITDNIMNLVPVTGEIEVGITANKATGTIDIIAYDVEAQAMADATLPDALESVGLDPEAVGVANPWSDVETAEAAAEGAGVGYFELPAEGTKVKGGEIHWGGYRYMQLLAQADGSVGSAELTVRKGVKNPAEKVNYDTSDVSGDYNEYKESWDVRAGDWTVKCFGNDKGKTMKAIWTSDNFSYSIMVRGQGDIADTYGLADEDIIAIVDDVQ